MAKTPYIKLSSEDILSAHISGLGNAINNLETALDMQTEVIADLNLDAVVDMEDASDKYKIYEGSKRCWLSLPAPVVKRNGVVVSSSEYIIQPAYGVVVFHTPQKNTDIIKVDVTIIKSESLKINTINSNITNITNDITKINADIKTLSNSASEDSVNIGVTSKVITNSANKGIPPENADAWISEGILIPSGVYEAFPFIVEQDSRISTISIENTALAGTGVFVRAGIYKADPITGNPKTFVARSGDYKDLDKTTGVKTLTFNLNLEAGIYYIAMYYSGNAFVKGMKNKYCLGLNVGDNYKSKINNSEKYPKIGSIRTASGQPTNFAYDVDFPAIQYYCGREATASPMINIMEQIG